jgi:hypothetical protein
MSNNKINQKKEKRFVVFINQHHNCDFRNVRNFETPSEIPGFVENNKKTAITIKENMVNGEPALEILFLIQPASKVFQIVDSLQVDCEENENKCNSSNFGLSTSSSFLKCEKPRNLSYIDLDFPISEEIMLECKLEDLCFLVMRSCDRRSSTTDV